jgi:hypothetical protein
MSYWFIQEWYMSRELDLLAKQFSKTPATVLRSEYSLYQKDLVREATKFLREVEKVAKKEKSGQVVIVAVVTE